VESCQCQGIEAKFDREYVAKHLRDYRKKGPENTTLQLVDALRAEGVQGLTLLDIGGGVGDIQHELLKSGVASAVDNEASSAFAEACQEEAVRQGHGDRIKHVQGNFTDVTAQLEPADIVTLDRVICCYDDMPALVRLSAEKARKLYGVVYPLDRWWIRLGVVLYYNLRHRLSRNPMRQYIYPKEDIDAVISAAGLRQVFHRLMGAWHVAVYARPSSA
jgi:hypothetical protein